MLQAVLPVTGPYQWLNTAFVLSWCLSWAWFIAATITDPGFYISNEGRSLQLQAVPGIACEPLCKSCPLACC